MRHRGAPVYRMTSVGAFMEKVVVASNSVIALPDQFPLEEAALIGCAALTGVGVVHNVADVQPGARTLVIGAGGVGQSVVQALRIAGAAVIAVSDPSAERRAQAEAFGATHAVAPDELSALIGELREGFDVTFEAAGHPATVRTALDATRIGGMTTLVGMAPTGTEVAGLAELGEDRDRRQPVDSVDLVNQGATARLLAGDRVQLGIKRNQLGVERVDDLQRDVQLLAGRGQEAKAGDPFAALE